jgi:endonuclease YncB( thermonuclease family)
MWKFAFTCATLAGLIAAFGPELATHREEIQLELMQFLPLEPLGIGERRRTAAADALKETAAAQDAAPEEAQPTGHAADTATADAATPGAPEQAIPATEQVEFASPAERQGTGKPNGEPVRAAEITPAPVSASPAGHSAEIAAAVPPPVAADAIAAAFETMAAASHPQAAPVPVALAARPVLRVSPPYEPLDSFRFRTREDVEIVLADLAGPSRGEICVDAAGARWTCGLYARAALYRLIKSSDLQCTGVSSLHPKLVLASCKAFEGDIASRMVKAGWGVPDSPKGPLAEILATAKRSRVGMWAEAAPRFGDMPGL